MSIFSKLKTKKCNNIEKSIIYIECADKGFQCPLFIGSHNECKIKYYNYSIDRIEIEHILFLHSNLSNYFMLEYNEHPQNIIKRLKKLKHQICYEILRNGGLEVINDRINQLENSMQQLDSYIIKCSKNIRAIVSSIEQQSIDLKQELTSSKDKELYVFSSFFDEERYDSDIESELRDFKINMYYQVLDELTMLDTENPVSYIIRRNIDTILYMLIVNEIQRIDLGIVNRLATHDQFYCDAFDFITQHSCQISFSELIKKCRIVD